MNTGDNINAKVGRWSFEGDVTENFSNHIRRSVPLYEEGHDLIVKLSDFFVMDNSVCYDLGCSNGDLTIKLADRNADKKAKFIGIEAVKEMCNTADKQKGDRKNIDFINDNILEFELDPSDFIISYYTVQFIRPKMRQTFIDTIYHKLNWGGAFIMFEKVRGSDARFQDISTTLYLEFKKSQGYSNDEILDKHLSLKGILEPFSSQANIDMLKRAGFVDILPIMKYVCFEGLLAIK